MLRNVKTCEILILVELRGSMVSNTSTKVTNLQSKQYITTTTKQCDNSSHSNIIRFDFGYIISFPFGIKSIDILRGVWIHKILVHKTTM